MSTKKNKKYGINSDNNTEKKSNKYIDEIDNSVNTDIIDNESLITTDDIFKLTDLLFYQKDFLFLHQISSFNKFIEEDVIMYIEKQPHILFNTLYSHNSKGYKYELVFKNTTITPPYDKKTNNYLYPSVARKCGLSYLCDIRSDIIFRTTITNLNTAKVIINDEPAENSSIAIVPIMIKSNLCNLITQGDNKFAREECDYDPGGYFIINGNEKVVISQEHMKENKILVFLKDGEYKAELRSKVIGKYSSTNPLTIFFKSEDNLYIRTKMFKEFNVFILLRAMGLRTDRDIINYVSCDPNDSDMVNLLKKYIERSKTHDKDKDKDSKDNNDTNSINTETDAIKYVAKKLINNNKKKGESLEDEDKLLNKKIDNIFKNDFLPHINASVKVKSIFLAYMINRLLNVILDRAKPDDRDAFINKNIDTTGVLMMELFVQNFKKMVDECGGALKERLGSGTQSEELYSKPPAKFIISKKIDPTKIKHQIIKALSTGSWGIRNSQGVAQVLQRMSYLKTISDLRRISTPSVSTTNKLTSPRHVHSTQYFYLCLTGDTDVCMSDNTLKKIKDVKNGDSVKTYDFINNKLIDSKIKNFFKIDSSKLSESLYKLTIFENTKYVTYLKCTGDHMILTYCDNETKFEYIETSKLNLKTRVVIYPNNIQNLDSDFTVIYDKYKINNNIYAIDIDKITKIEQESVYDFETVADTHNFIANNIITHNCPVESPDGAKLGLVKNLSMTSTITQTITSQITIIGDFLKSLKMYDSDEKNDDDLKIYDIETIIDVTFLKRYYKVFFNGEIYGIVVNPTKLFDKLKDMKITGKLDKSVAIVRDSMTKELRINCDQGRLIRPVLRVNPKTNQLIIKKEHIDNIVNMDEYDNEIYGKISSWNELIIKHNDAIEYLDIEESMYSMIASYKDELVEERKIMNADISNLENINNEKSNMLSIDRYNNKVYRTFTHCEIHPSLMLGIITNNIPFCNHNQAPRCIFQYSQARQTMGIYASNYRHRLDLSYILYYPERPLVSTRLMKYIRTIQLPAGNNVLTAIAVYTGYNQEDSVILHGAAVNRGLFIGTVLKKHISEIKKNANISRDDMFITSENIETIKLDSNVYSKDKLNKHGYVDVDTEVLLNDIIIGKATPYNNIISKETNYKDSSEIYKSNVPGFINAVYPNLTTSDGYPVIKMSVRSERIPQIGDKLCFLNNTEVLTSIGWIKIDKINKYHKVCTLVDGENIVYQSPIGIYNYDYCGNIYKLESPYIDLEVTMDHDLYVNLGDKFKLIPAKYVYESDKDKIFKISGKNINKSDVNFNYNRLFKNVINWLIDDSTDVQDDYFDTVHMHNNVWKLDADNSKKLLESIIKKMFISINPNDNSNCFYRKLFSENKKDFIQQLALMCETYVSVSKLQNTTNEISAKEYVVEYYPNPLFNNATVKIGKKDINISETDYKYNGKVYCIEVESHVFMSRLNNKITWIGNCSRSAQKGTIGMIYNTSDMPFTEKDGLVPDLILNPNAIPSRMTISQLIECVQGKLSALECKSSDGTPFEPVDMKSIRDGLEKHGYNKFGLEFLYNGKTGERMEAMTFIGPTYYQRLKHIVADKIHSRSGNGPKNQLVRQPSEGRSRDGGLRFGNMEKDCMISHGATSFVREKMVDCSDKHIYAICNICGVFAANNVNNKEIFNRRVLNYKYNCIRCKNTSSFSEIVIPYACKLLFQELFSMNIAARIRTDNHIKELPIFK